MYLEAAKRAMEFVLTHLRKGNGRLLHRYRDGEAEIEAYLNDYAYLIWALIELYEASFDAFYLKTALELNKIANDHYWDDYIGGYFFTADDGEELLTRRKELYDGATPSGNSISFLNLLRLSYMTGDHELEQKADIINRVFSERVKGSYLAYTQFIIAIDFALGPTYSLVIAGDSQAKNTSDMLESVRIQYLPNKVMIFRKTDDKSPEIDKYANFVEWFNPINDKATAYVCVNKTCKKPTNDHNQMVESLQATWD
jgi:hypothetical protein